MLLLEITLHELIGTLFKGEVGGGKERLAILEISLLTYWLHCFLISVCWLAVFYRPLPVERCPFPFMTSEFIDILVSFSSGGTLLSLGTL